MEPGLFRSGELQARLKRIAAHSPDASRYEILGEIGEGGMGHVFRVRDRLLERTLAMKVLEKDGADEEVLQRFLEEAQLTSDLDHPGIVPVHDMGLRPDGRVYYTMPLVDGRTLDTIFEQVRRGEQGFSIKRVLFYLLQACEAVAFAHARGVVHLDLKPANLMIGRHGEVLVMDWGLARYSDHVNPEAIAGTPAYMPPEQITAEGEVGPTADVYAMGAILYELSTGVRPFSDERGASSRTGLDRLLNEPPTPISRLNPSLSEEFIAISEKAMAREPSERYETMAELNQDLVRFLEGRVVAAHPVGAVRRVGKWVRRNPWIATLLSVVFMGLSATVIVQSKNERRLERAHDATTRSAYLGNLSAAEASLRMSETGEAKRRLVACAPQLRGWEWLHLSRRTDSSDAVFGAGPDDVDAVAVAPGGARIATGSYAGLVALWDAQTGERLSVREVGAPVDGLAFAPESAALAVALEDGRLLLLGAEQLRPIEDWQAHSGTILGLAIAPDGRTIASASLDGTVRVMRPDGDVLTTEIDFALALSFVDVDTLVVGTGEGDVLLLETRDLSERRRTRPSVRPIHTVSASPNSEWIATGSQDGTVRLFDARTLAVQAELTGHTDLIAAADFSDDGRILATASDDKTLALWDVPRLTLRARRFGHDGRIEALKFFPGGRRLVTGSSDGTARTWSTAGSAARILRAHDDWVEAAEFLPDPTRPTQIVSIGRDGMLRVWDSDTGEEMLSTALGDTPTSLAIAPGGLQAACGTNSGEVLTVNLETGEATTSHDVSPAHVVALAQAGEALFARTSDGEILALSDEAKPLLAGLDGRVASLAARGDGRRVAAGTDDGRVILVDTASGELVATIETRGRGVTALAFTPDGTRLGAGCADGAVHLFDASSGSALITLRGHDDRVTDLVFSPDGERVFSASQDRTLRVWSDADLLLTLRGQESWLNAVAVDVTGKRIASAARDGTVRIWRAD